MLMNWLGSEGHWVEVKVDTWSDVQNIGALYLLNGSKDLNHISVGLPWA